MLEENKIVCLPNLCPPDSSTDVDYVVNSGLGSDVSQPSRFVVEFGSENSSINVSEGNEISSGEIIGYIDNVPVKSILNGKITEKNDTYFIGDYSTNTDDVEKMLASLDSQQSDMESQFDKMNETLKEYSNVTTFIKDYILRFRFADIANNYITHNDAGTSQSYNTTSRICEIYNKDTDKILDTFNKEIRKVCDAKNIQTYCENNDIDGIKNEINKVKKKYFDKIIKQYNNVQAYGFNSGRLSDLMIYDEYFSYITSENFVYDDENPYVVELFYHLTTFMQIRSKLEMNSTNIEGLLIKFKTMCDDTIRKYWDDTLYDYYGRLRQMFKFDFYANNDNDLIQASIHDKKRVTLYSKVLKYLESLCKYTEPKSQDEKFKGMNMDDIIKNAQIQDNVTQTTESQFHSKLEKIALFFVQLRKIESDIDPKYFKQFTSESDYDDLFTLKNQIGDSNIKGYLLSFNNVAGRSVQPDSAFEEKYLDPFKKLVQKESMVLRKLADKAIKFYIDNDENINSGQIFNEMKEADWGNKTTIFRNGDAYDFYYITADTDKKEDTDNFTFTENGTRTQYGITDYAYWVKYCCNATLVNCMFPAFWSAGLIIAGAPIYLPIIYMPFTVISGRVTVVIGMGICGICPYPMILFVNLSDTVGSMIPIINTNVDILKALIAKLPTLSVSPIKETIKRLIKHQDERITDLRRKKKDIQNTILNLQSGIKTDKETLRNLKKKRKEISTSNTTKSQAND